MMTKIDPREWAGELGIPTGFTARAFCKESGKSGSNRIEQFIDSSFAMTMSELQRLGNKDKAAAIAGFLKENGLVTRFTDICRAAAGASAPVAVEPSVEPVGTPEPAPLPPTPVPAADDVAAKLEALQALTGLLGGGGMTEAEKKRFLDEATIKVMESVIDKVTEQYGSNGGNVTRIQVIDKVTGEPSGEPKLAHSITELATTIASPDCNLALTGEAGGGKTHLCGMIAEARGLPFVPISCNPVMTPGQLIGARGLNGFDEATLVKACREGMLVLLDEFDNMRGDIAAVVNSLLANRTITISHTGETIVCHPDTVFVVAMNTYGTGATDLYQRQRMDAATMDRFMFLNMKYDPALEAAMSGCNVKVKSPDYRVGKGGALESKEAWFHYIQKVRETLHEKGIKHVVSPRATKTGIALAEKGVGVHWLREGLVFKGLPAQHRKAIEEATKNCKLVAA